MDNFVIVINYPFSLSKKVTNKQLSFISGWKLLYYSAASSASDL